MTLESLTELATKSGSGRWSAFYAIGAHGSAAAIQVLEDYAFGADPQARMVATEVLGLLPTVDPDIVVRALCDSYGAVARTACKIVVRRRLLQARPQLRSLSVSAETRTRATAVRALGELGDCQ